MKRGYLVSDKNKDYGYPVIAHNAKEAKMIVWKERRNEFDNWIDVKVNWRKDAVIDELPFGTITDDLEAVKRKLMDYIWN